MSTGRRLFWIVRFLILTLLISIAFSWKIWFQFDLVPQVPMFDVFPTFTPIVQKILMVVTVAYLIALLFFTSSRLPIGIGVVLLFLIVLQDWNRLQPWFMQCSVMLLLLIPLQKMYRNYESMKQLDWLFRLSLVGLYFWAGAFKLNPSFNDLIVPYITYPITSFLTTYKSEVWAVFGLVPYAEIIFALGLIIPKISKFSVIGLIIFHLSIVLLFGPFGLDSNQIIIVWNLGMIMILWIGIGFTEPVYDKKIWSKTNKISLFALLFFTIVPVLNYFGVYNKSIAFEIYSGTNYVRHIKAPVSKIRQLPEIIDKHSYKYQDTLFINTYELYDEIYNLPPNADPKVINKLEKLIQSELY